MHDGSAEGRGRILIVDDQQEIRNLLSDILGDEHDCTLAASGAEALAHLRGGDFDLLLCDITMPGMTGLELVPLARAASPRTVVVMISGLQSIESAVEAVRSGAFDYVTKPFDLDAVTAAVGRALEHARLREAKRLYEIRLEELVARRTAELDRALESVERAYRTTLAALTAALDARDHETCGHSRRVVAFSLRLGRELGLDADNLRSLEFGALLHDIGKIAVPDAILRKPDRLDEGEWERMKQHPLDGARILAGIEFLRGASRVVAEHHERWDGAGYTRALRGDEIDLNARIFSVADAFDAITSDRVYRQARTHDEALAELERGAGTQFDPRVVAAFRRVARAEWDGLRRECASLESAPAAAALDAREAAAPEIAATVARDAPAPDARRSAEPPAREVAPPPARAPLSRAAA
ncbi:MAG: HD-GYP domain-containing protein [Pyrinomonadaceae bacterium]